MVSKSATSSLSTTKSRAPTGIWIFMLLCLLLCLSWPALRQFDWKRIAGMVLRIIPGLFLAWPFFRWTSNWYTRNNTFDFHQILRPSSSQPIYKYLQDLGIRVRDY